MDVYTVLPWGLYMARPTPGRTDFGYLESWLLPELGLRANVFHFNPGYERDQDFYLDIGDYTPGSTVWHSQDHYLDLVVRTGAGVDVVDIDELMAAVQHGLLTADEAERAMTHAITAVDGLSRCGYDLNRWLSGKEMTLTWRDR